MVQYYEKNQVVFNVFNSEKKHQENKESKSLEAKIIKLRIENDNELQEVNQMLQAKDTTIKILKGLQEKVQDMKMNQILKLKVEHTKLRIEKDTALQEKSKIFFSSKQLVVKLDSCWMREMQLKDKESKRKHMVYILMANSIITRYIKLVVVKKSVVYENEIRINSQYRKPFFF